MTEKGFRKRRSPGAASQNNRLEKGPTLCVLKVRGHFRRPPGAFVLNGLNVLRWLVGRECRQSVDSVAADLKRDRKAMLSQGLNPWYIRVCLACGALRSFVPFLWHLFMVCLSNLAGAVDLIRKILGSR